MLKRGDIFLLQSGFGNINKTETNYSFNGQYLVKVEGVYILDHTNERVGVLIGEYEELEQAYLEKCDKFDEYENLLIENGIIEKQYTKEELIEIERKQDREKIEKLTQAVDLLLKKSEEDYNKINELAGLVKIQQENFTNNNASINGNKNQNYNNKHNVKNNSSPKQSEFKGVDENA